MRTIKQYVDWMKLCRKLDPDCTFLNHHFCREGRPTEEELREYGATKRISDIERRLYTRGPTELVDLDNSILTASEEKDKLEELLDKTGFEIVEKTSKRNSKIIFNDNVPALWTNYEHRDGVVSLQLFYGIDRPLLHANIKAKKGTGLVSYYDIIEEVRSGDAEYSFYATIFLNNYGKRKFIPNQSRFEARKALNVGMRDNSLQLLEAIVKKKIPAILYPKPADPVLLNIP